MRTRSASNGVTLNVVAGTHIVLLAFDLSEARRTTCLGFAIQRQDRTTGAKVWLKGMKTFEQTDPGLAAGELVSTLDHPVQSFQWADYDVVPGRKYTYWAYALSGTGPLDLVRGPPIQATITTEPTEPTGGSVHSVFFNRGSVASQAYAREFDNIPPNAITDPARRAAAYAFLSRGLEEALLAFIGRADGPDYALHAAMYEFRWPSVLEALGAAAQTGAEVAIIYDAIPGSTKPGVRNLEAITAAGIGDIVTPRTKGTIMHNKFIVLSRNGVPEAVWTGSTNITEQGIFGHLNLGHAVEDRAVAQQFRDYWDVVVQNQTRSPETQDVAALAVRPPEPPLPLTGPILTTFSPQPTAAMLDWYAALAATAQHGLFMTFAFGMNDRFADLYERRDDVLRLALMETEGTGTREKIEEARKRINAMRRRRNVVVAVGGKQAISGVERWLDELRQISSTVHVLWIHTKFALIDPLGDEPVVITGSANFSDASMDKNHENMLVIAGDQRVADIYFTEYLRLFAHYAFRETLIKREIWDLADWRPEHLVPNPSWTDDYYRPGQRSARRRYYAQT